MTTAELTRRTLKHKRGPLADIPHLAEAEFYFATDTEEWWSGTSAGENIPVGSVSAFQALLDDEIRTREAVDSIKANTSYVDSQDDAMRVYIDLRDGTTLDTANRYAESYSESQDGALHGVLSAEFAASIEAEAVARDAGDTATLGLAEASISTEAAARTSADATTLASAESYTDTAIASEASTRAVADAATLATAESYSDSAIATEAGLRTAAVTAEATARANADTAEATARAAGDAATLASAEAYTDAETTARTTAVSAEATARANADTAEATARANADALKADKTYVDSQDALALPLTGGTLSGACTLKNSTLATSSVSQSSPIETLSGQFWNGSASAEDKWTIQNVIANGTNGISTLAIGHSGSSSMGCVLKTQALTLNLDNGLSGAGTPAPLTVLVNQSSGNGFLINRVAGTDYTYFQSGGVQKGLLGVGAVPMLFSNNSASGITLDKTSALVSIGNGTLGDVSGQVTAKELDLGVASSSQGILKFFQSTGSTSAQFALAGNTLTATVTDISFSLGNSRIFTITNQGTATINLTNTAAATSGASASSPTLNFNGHYWDGAASQTDAWTIQDIVANGTNGTSTLTITHSGSSGVAAVSTPILSITGQLVMNSQNIQFVGANGNANILGYHGSTDPGLLFKANNVYVMKLCSDGSNTGRVQYSSNGFLAWANSTAPYSATLDTSISRIGIATLAIGNGTAGNTSGTLNAATLIENTSHTPASASDTGTTGTIAWDANYIYICVATNTWKRAALSTW